LFPRRPGPRRPFTRSSQSYARALPRSRCLSYRALDPRPRPSPRLALFTRGADRRFSGSGYRPTTSATDFRRTDTLPSIRFSHSSRRPAHQDWWAVTSNLRSFSPACLRLATFPSRRRTTSTANRDSPSEAGSTTLQARRKTRPRKPSSDRNAACGRRFDPTTVCGDGRWTTALDCVGRVALSEGPSLPPPAAAERRGRRFPSSRRATRAPLWVVGSSYCGLDVPAVLTNRPRPSFLRRPAKGNAFPKAGMPFTPRNPGEAKIALRPAWTGTFHYAAARLSLGRHCNRRYRRLSFQL